jgi:hypothetical protein
MVRTYHKRSDAVLEELVDEVGVVFDALLVHRVVPTAEWNDARPGEREAIGLRSVLLQESDVLGVPAVGCLVVSFGLSLEEPARTILAVRRRVPRLSVERIARCAGEVVPDGLAAPVHVQGSFDLKSGLVRAEFGR